MLLSKSVSDNFLATVIKEFFVTAEKYEVNFEESHLLFYVRKKIHVYYYYTWIVTWFFKEKITTITLNELKKTV